MSEVNQPRPDAVVDRKIRTASGEAAPPGAGARGLSEKEAQERLELDGSNDVPEQKDHPLRRLAGRFWGLSAWMLELIAALSLVLGKTTDFAIAVALLVVNAILSFMQEQRASAAVRALRHRLQVTARVLRDGLWRAIPAQNLVRGDVIRVRIGDFVPADAQVIEGTLKVDQSALTGESRDIEKDAGAAVHSGSVVRSGEATALVTATGTRTYFGRTTQLVESAHPKLHVEDVIARTVRRLFVIVGAMAAITVAASLVEGLPLLDILPLSLVLLMSAVPVALPVMFTVSMAVGAIELARHGVLVTRLSAAEDAASMDVLCADKTGTLTQNRLSLVGTIPQPGFSEHDVLRNAALASSEANQDPIDLAFLHAARTAGLIRDDAKIIAFTPFSAATRRTEALVASGGGTVRVVKGALRTVAELAHLEASAADALDARAREAGLTGARVLAVARDDAQGSLRLVGLALLSDPPRPDSRQLIAQLRALGVTVKMLTGDALGVAREIGNGLGLGDIVRAGPHSDGASTDAGNLIRTHDGIAEIYPEDKFSVVKGLQAERRIVGMTGDGVNDAPALRQAEVGIAVSGATDVAKAAASVVLTSEGLIGIVNLVTNGRVIYQRVLTWIINKVSRTLLKAGFVVVPFLATGKFVISALGMVLVVFMTDFVKIALSTDRAQPSPRPETWNIGPLVLLAVGLGLVMLAEALTLLWLGWHRLDLGAHDGRLRTFAFETLLFFALFSILSIRERRAFWASRPSLILSVALLADACAGIAIGLAGVGELEPLTLGEIAFVAAFAFVFSLIVNDFIKVALLARLSEPGWERAMPRLWGRGQALDRVARRDDGPPKR